MARIAAASRRTGPNDRTSRKAKTGAEALFGVRPTLQDQLAQGRRGRADRGGFMANALDRPIGIAPVARRHVVGNGGMPVIAAGAQMCGDPLALEKISTVRGISRTSTSRRAKRYGTL